MNISAIIKTTDEFQNVSVTLPWAGMHMHESLTCS